VFVQKKRFQCFIFYSYIEDLTNGTYLQQTVETVVGNEAGKQLMVRRFSLISVMIDKNTLRIKSFNK
jgi:ubiquitin C-terminal hydrolase